MQELGLAGTHHLGRGRGDRAHRLGSWCKAQTPGFSRVCLRICKTSDQSICMQARKQRPQRRSWGTRLPLGRRATASALSGHCHCHCSPGRSDGREGFVGPRSPRVPLPRDIAPILVGQAQDARGVPIGSTSGAARQSFEFLFLRRLLCVCVCSERPLRDFVAAFSDTLMRTSRPGTAQRLLCDQGALVVSIADSGEPCARWWSIAHGNLNTRRFILLKLQSVSSQSCRADGARALGLTPLEAVAPLRFLNMWAAFRDLSFDVGARRGRFWKLYRDSLHTHDMFMPSLVAVKPALPDCDCDVSPLPPQRIRSGHRAPRSQAPRPLRGARAAPEEGEGSDAGSASEKRIAHAAWRPRP